MERRTSVPTAAKPSRDFRAIDFKAEALAVQTPAGLGGALAAAEVVEPIGFEIGSLAATLSLGGRNFKNARRRVLGDAPEAEEAQEAVDAKGGSPWKVEDAGFVVAPKLRLEFWSIHQLHRRQSLGD